MLMTMMCVFGRMMSQFADVNTQSTVGMFHFHHVLHRFFLHNLYCNSICSIYMSDFFLFILFLGWLLAVTCKQGNLSRVSHFLPRCMQCRRGLAMRILSVCLSVCLSVRLSVCLSVTRVHCDKTVERSVLIYIPYERTFIPIFWEEEWLVGGDPFYLKFWVNRPPLERNRRFSTNNRS